MEFLQFWVREPLIGHSGKKKTAEKCFLYLGTSLGSNRASLGTLGVSYTVGLGAVRSFFVRLRQSVGRDCWPFTVRKGTPFVPPSNQKYEFACLPRVFALCASSLSRVRVHRTTSISMLEPS